MITPEQTECQVLRPGGGSKPHIMGLKSQEAGRFLGVLSCHPWATKHSSSADLLFKPEL